MNIIQIRLKNIGQSYKREISYLKRKGNLSFDLHWRKGFKKGFKFQKKCFVEQRTNKVKRM